MIQDQSSVREMPTLGGQGLILPLNGNLSFAQSAVEQLAGDSNLIAVRSRASRERPFTVVQKLQADAEANYRTKIKDLEGSLAETQRKLNELQRSKDEGQRFILSPAQQQELATFRQTEAGVKTQLKEMRRKLRAEIDSLENRIKWINIAGMPAIVILAGFALAMMKRRGSGNEREATRLRPSSSRRARRDRSLPAPPQRRFLERHRRRLERKDSRLSAQRRGSAITIKTGAAELDLRKKEDVWRVAERADYPADFEKVASLIRKLWELRAVQEVQAGHLAARAARTHRAGQRKEQRDLDRSKSKDEKAPGRASARQKTPLAIRGGARRRQTRRRPLCHGARPPRSASSSFPRRSMARRPKPKPGSITNSPKSRTQNRSRSPGSRRS